MNPTFKPRPPLAPQRGSSLAGKAYWAMVQRVALTAAAIDVGYIVLFLWLGSLPLAAINVISIGMYLGAYRLLQKRYYLGLHALSSHLGPLDPLPARSVNIVNWVHICLVFAMSAALSAFYRRTILIAEARLRKQATLDPLTGLANRSHFEALSTNALARSQRDGAPVTLLLCDVDLFKRINDQYGHAERIRTAIEQTPLDVGQAPIALTMSFGVAQVHSAEDLQAAIARADKALYQSKNAGRNRVSVA